MLKNETEKLYKKILKEVAIVVCKEIVLEALDLSRNISVSKINISEWDESYTKANKLIREMDVEKYDRHRNPSTRADWCELSCDTSYRIKLSKGNYMTVSAFKSKEGKSIISEQRLKLTFFGNDRYRYKKKFLDEVIKLTDEKHIKVMHMNEKNVSCDIIPHDINKIVLKDDVRNRIVKGLSSWKSSKDWYESKEIVHKIGILLYGDPGTGKSTIAKAISKMFSNAPILTIDADDVMYSISGIISMRRKYTGTIIVLIEDFDMYFKSREEEEGIELNIEQKKRKDANQNYIFQVLDGIYSTDNTIYIATTNYKDRLDPALIRYGRFDIQEELKYFDKEDAVKAASLLGYGSEVLEELDLEYPIQPSLLQGKIMEYRSNVLLK